MSQIEAINIPKWGMTMTEGTITGWLVPEGSAIAKGQEILEIETTKVTNAVESSASGILRRIVLATGTTAPVGALAGVIADSSATDSEIEAFIQTYADRSGATQTSGDEVPAARLIEAGAQAINVLELGSRGEDSVVFLHGFGGDLTTWMFNQPVLAEHMHAIALDLPGHGNSSLVPADATLASIVEPVKEVVEKIAGSRIHLVAHSFGGAVATELAEQLGNRTASVMLIAPVGLGAQMNTQFLHDFISAERRKPLLNTLEKLFSDPAKITSDMVEATLSFKRLEGVPEGLRAIAHIIANDNSQRQDIRAKLAALKCPVAVIWGAEDGIVPVPEMAALPPNVTLQVIPGVGHMPQMEAATAVNDVIQQGIASA